MRFARLLVIVLAGLAAIYGAATASLYIAMRQPPERFGAIMSNVPMVAMMILPVRPLWMSARSGPLSVGDAAPDFTLLTVDRSRTVQLSKEWQARPVALIFGSYT